MINTQADLKQLLNRDTREDSRPVFVKTDGGFKQVTGAGVFKAFDDGGHHALFLDTEATPTDSVSISLSRGQWYELYNFMDMWDLFSPGELENVRALMTEIEKAGIFPGEDQDD